MPGGGLSFDGSKWAACQPWFFLPVRVLSRVFRGKFLALLRGAFDQGNLSFHGKLAALADPRQFQFQLAARTAVDAQGPAVNIRDAETSSFPDPDEIPPDFP